MDRTDRTKRWRWAARHRTVATGIGIVLTLIGTALAVTTVTVHHRLLRGSTYERALDSAEVYRRVYSEVLTDPLVRDATEQILGDLRLGGNRSLADTTALSNAITRLALPPSTLRTVFDRVIRATLRYLRGETDRLDATIDLSALLDLDAGVQSAIASLLQSASTTILDNLPAYEAAVRSFANDLASGHVPTSIPIIGGAAVSEAEIIRTIQAAARFGLSRSTLNQVVAAVRSGDAREALVTAAAAFVRSHVRALATELRTDGELRIDLIDALGRQAGQPQQRLVATLNSLRDTAARFPAWLVWVALAMGVLGLAFVAAAWGLRWRTLPVLATMMIAASGTVWLVARVAGRFVPSPFDRAASSGGGNGLPRSVRHILGDVQRFIAADLFDGVDDVLVGITLVATAMLAAAAMAAFVTSVRRGGARRVTAFAAAATILLALFVPLTVSALSQDSVRQCNGHRELCGRRYDQIVQAATHNSMSSPDVVQIWPEHDADITAQLDYGIRTLLIDTHYWTAIDTPAALSTIEQAVPADIAAYLYATLGARLRAHSGTYLCHSRCAYGAVSFTGALSAVRNFLEANPDEVVTLIIQNGITTADTESAFEESGLAPYLYDGSPTDGWPTLGEMVDSGQRLVVFAEAAGPPPAWYHSYGELVQDTAYHVQRTEDFTCALQRGDPNAPLFMLNNWIQREAPDRADAQIVNQRSFIVQRARRCAAERGRLPNFIAVNFFSIGDVVGAVDALNGLG